MRSANRTTLRPLTKAIPPPRQPSANPSFAFQTNSHAKIIAFVENTRESVANVPSVFSTIADILQAIENSTLIDMYMEHMSIAHTSSSPAT
jgi:hypothetical protein